MHATPLRRVWPLLAAVAGGLSLAACSTVGDSTRGALRAVTPYKVEVQQGNFVSKEQVEALKPGMTRQQVREILGTTVLSDVFHADRWDYVFTIRRQGVDPLQRHLAVYFKGEYLDHYEGDPMPSEEEFVASVDTRGKAGKVPKLEADPGDLEKYAPKADEKPQEAAKAPLPPLPPSYPPLESGR